jgi:putative tryptophan/tyrosine transport system substrate-binding protein
MRRRQFMFFLGGAATTWTTAGSAQKALPLIGFLGNQPQPPSNDAQGNALMQGFRDNGLMPGRDFVLEPLFTGGDDTRFPVFARALAQKNARIIMANTPAGVRAAQRLDPPIPVLMVNMNDPVGQGLIESLARPGGHTTGTASLNADVTPKLLDFIREIFPSTAVVAVIFNPSNPSNPVLVENLKAQASPLRITVLPFPMKSPDDLDAVFRDILVRRPDVLQIVADPLLTDAGGLISERALENRIPTFTNNEVAVESCGLLSYGASTRKVLRRMGYYARKILDGANPNDLPVEQPTGLELNINLKAAKVLGIEIPAALVARADRVIE